jgi:hypothetical protein
MEVRIIKATAMALCLTALSVNAQIKEVSGFQNPESIAGKGDKLYVSNMGAVLDPKAKDGDGYISTVSRRDGKIIESKFITGLNSPKGLLIHCGKIIVADVDKVIAFDLKTKKKVWEADLSKVGSIYANDLAKKMGGVFVTSTDNNVIYKVCKSGKKIKRLMVKTGLPGANGLAKGCGKLYVANYGKEGLADGSFGQVNRCNKKFKVLQSGGMYDGIVKVGHLLIVSDWVSHTENKGRLVVYNLCKKKATVPNLGRTIDGPASLFADGKTKTVWVPAMRENKIIGFSCDFLKGKTAKK